MVATIVYLAVILAYTVLISLTGVTYKRQKKSYLVVLIVLMSGLLFDSLVIGLGSLIGEGPLLLGLNVSRFYVHAIFTPLACLIGLYQARDTDIEYTLKRNTKPLTLVLVVLFIAVGLVQLVGATFVPEVFDGTLRYVTEVSSGPPLGAIGTIFFVLAVGVLLAREKMYWVLIGAVVMILGASVPISTYGPLPQSLAEVVFLCGFVMHELTLKSDAHQ